MGLKNRLGALVITLSVVPLLFGCSEEKKTNFMGKSQGPPPSFFSPNEDDIVVEEASGLSFVKDVLNITFSKDTSQETAKRIISSVNATIVGYDYSVNFYQIRFPDTDFKTMQKIKMKMLADHKELELATSTPVSAKKNPYYAR